MEKGKGWRKVSGEKRTTNNTDCIPKYGQEGAGRGPSIQSPPSLGTSWLYLGWMLGWYSIQGVAFSFRAF